MQIHQCIQTKLITGICFRYLRHLCIHIFEKAEKLFRVFYHPRNFLPGIHLEYTSGKRPLGYRRSCRIKADHSGGELLTLIGRHADIVLRSKKPVLTDQAVDPLCRLRIIHTVHSRRVPVASGKHDALCTIVCIGFISTRESMAPSAGAILVFEIIRPFPGILVPQEKRICRNSPVGIRSAGSKKSIRLFLGNENTVFRPGKAIPRIEGDSFLGKVPELCQHPVGIVIREPHKVGSFSVGCSKPFQAFQKISYKCRVIQLL